MNKLLGAALLVFPFSNLLLAQASRFEGLKSAFTRPHTQIHTSDVLNVLVILIGLGLLIWMLATRYAYHEQKVTDSPKRLFLSLCRAHGLSLRNRWLLLRLARHRGLSDPTRVFLDPAHLETADLPPSLKTRARELSEIRFRLFADLAGPATSGVHTL